MQLKFFTIYNKDNLKILISIEYINIFNILKFEIHRSNDISISITCTSDKYQRSFIFVLQKTFTLKNKILIPILMESYMSGKLYVLSYVSGLSTLPLA